MKVFARAKVNKITPKPSVRNFTSFKARSLSPRMAVSRILPSNFPKQTKLLSRPNLNLVSVRPLMASNLNGNSLPRMVGSFSLKNMPLKTSLPSSDFFKTSRTTGLFSPVDHIQTFLRQASGGRKGEIHIADAPLARDTPNLQNFLEKSEMRPNIHEASVEQISRDVMQLSEQEMDSLRETFEMDEPSWRRAQEWLAGTDYRFVHQDENFAFLVLKEDGELPAVRISWDPSYRSSLDEDNYGDDPELMDPDDEEGLEKLVEGRKGKKASSQENEEEEEEDENMDDEDELPSGSGSSDQPFEIQIRNPNKVRGGQLVIRALVGPEEKFYIQEFWAGTGTNLSLDTWLSGAESADLNFMQIEDYSTDFRHSLYDYLDVVGISDNVAKFISAHTRVNLNVKQREMLVRLIQFMEPMADHEEQRRQLEEEGKKTQIPKKKEGKKN